VDSGDAIFDSLKEMAEMKMVPQLKPVEDAKIKYHGY
jgi:hypothetical protein